MTSRFPAWLLLLGALTALGPLSIDMYLPAFPAIAQALGTDRGSVERSLPIFLAGLAFAQLAYGPLSDRYGRRMPVLIGLAVYFVGSLGCAMAEHIGSLSVWRLVQALGAGAGTVIARAVIRDRLDPRDSARASSSLMLVMGLAPILAPLAGSAMLEVGSWRLIFAFQTAFALALLLWAALGMRETRPAGAGASLSPRSLVRGYLALLSDRTLLWPALCGGFAFAGMFAYIAGSPFVMISLYGLDSRQYGLAFGLNALGLIAASQLNGASLRRAQPAQVLGRTFWLPAAAGLALLVTSLSGHPPLALLMGGLFVYVASLGAISPNTGALAMARQARTAGAAAALLGAMVYLGGMFAGFAVSLLEGLSVRPLAVIMAACGLGCAFCGWQTLRGAPETVTTTEVLVEPPA